MENQIEENKEKPEQPEIAPIQAPVELKIEPKKEKIKITISKRALVAAAIIIAIAAVGALAFYLKGLVIAATVDGMPIYRLSVIYSLERNAGKKTLDALITKKLIDNEARAKGVVVTPADVDAEIKKIEDQVKTQGVTLDQAISEQGITLNYLKDQITVQKELEGLLADQLGVTDADIKKYIADNKITVPKGEEANFNDQIKNQLKQQKLSDAATTLLDSLRAKSKINYFVNY